MTSIREAICLSNKNHVYQWFRHRKLYLEFVLFALFGCSNISLSWILLSYVIYLSYQHIITKPNLWVITSRVLEEMISSSEDENKAGISVLPQKTKKRNEQKGESLIIKKQLEGNSKLESKNSNSNFAINVLMAAIWDTCVRPNINETTANQILKRCRDSMNPEDAIKASFCLLYTSPSPRD